MTVIIPIRPINIKTITENLPLNNGIEYVFFEVISALATVGLSLGLTPDLTAIGKILIMVLIIFRLSANLSWRMIRTKVRSVREYKGALNKG